MTRGRRVGLAAAIALALFVAYEVISSFVAFTDDAYVQSDLVALAPQVTGRIIAVHVADNQDVAEGDLLASIDPVPFQLALDQRRADLAEARAQIASDQHRIASARDALAAASSAADFASENEKRLTTLASAQDVSRVALDQASDTLRRANAARDAAQESVAATEATLSMHQASHARANSALALAEWQLARTKLVAPTSGTVTSLSLRVGDTAQADVPLIGIVDARAWRIVANFKESYIRGFAVGSTAWVSLDSDPWHLRRAKVTGIARGISREPVPNRLLNYVAPTTDWIRLKRRFPVTLTLVDPPETLYGCRRQGGRAAMSGAATRAISALRRELLEIDLAGPRGHHCSRVALAVTLAVIVALVLRVDAPWWAAISAFVSTQVTAPSSLRRGALRIVGTAIGAAAGLLLSPWLIEDQVALSLALFIASSIGVLGLQVSRHGYAWLLGAVTADMVLLATLDDPTSALSVACNRTAEVTIGTLAAILVSHLLSPREDHAPPRPRAPGWSDLLGAQWASTQHAMRAGLGVMLVPLAWSWLQLPSFSQAAITVAAVMAVPAISDDDAANREKIAARGTHRILGCLIGGLAGLAVLIASFENFLPWLAALAIGVWVGAHVQASARDIGYVGTQGAVVFIMTMVQGSGPPSSIIPGIERLAGITGGLLIVEIVAILLTPSARSAETR